MRDTGLPSVLLTESSYLSTLAAVRSFGRAGIDCVVACDSRLGAASWSRFVKRRVRCPSYTDSGALLEWLLAYGAKHPGHVLYATSDDMAWLYALHHAELSRHFRMYQPRVETVYGLLNKQQLDGIRPRFRHRVSADLVSPLRGRRAADRRNGAVSGAVQAGHAGLSTATTARASSSTSRTTCRAGTWHCGTSPMHRTCWPSIRKCGIR